MESSPAAGRLPAWAREAGRWLPPVLAAILLGAAVFGCTSEIEPDAGSAPPPEAARIDLGEPVPAIPPAAGEMERSGGRPVSADEPAAGGIRRGRYLTERVARCVVCHSPRDEHGEVIAHRKFQGAPMPVEGPVAGPEWAVEVPAIAGMTFYTRDQAIRLLTRGIARDGGSPAPPMPRFRMTERDAAAVYDYLASLPPAP